MRPTLPRCWTTKDRSLHSILLCQVGRKEGEKGSQALVLRRHLRSQLDLEGWVWSTQHLCPQTWFPLPEPLSGGSMEAANLRGAGAGGRRGTLMVESLASWSRWIRVPAQPTLLRPRGLGEVTQILRTPFPHLSSIHRNNCSKWDNLKSKRE